MKSPSSMSKKLVLIGIWLLLSYSKLFAQDSTQLSLTLWEEKGVFDYLYLLDDADLVVLTKEGQQVTGSALEKIIAADYPQRYDLARSGNSLQTYPNTSIANQVYLVIARVQEGANQGIYFSSNQTGTNAEFKQVIKGEIRLWKIKEESLAAKIEKHFFDTEAYYTQVQQLDWEETIFKHTVEAYQTFQNRYPSSKYSEAAQRYIDELLAAKEESERAYLASEAWEKVNKQRLAELEQYMDTYPNSEYVALAEQLARQLREEELYSRGSRTKDITALEQYITEYPDGKYAGAVLALIRDYRDTQSSVLTFTIFGGLLLILALFWKLVVVLILSGQKLHAIFRFQLKKLIQIPKNDAAIYIVKLLIIACLWGIASLALAAFMQLFVQGAVRTITPRMLTIGLSITTYYVIYILTTKQGKSLSNSASLNGNVFIGCFVGSSIVVSLFLYAIGNWALKGWSAYAGDFIIQSILFAVALFFIFNLQDYLQKYGVSQRALYRFVKTQAYEDLLKKLVRATGRGLGLILHWLSIGLIWCISFDFLFLPTTQVVSRTYLSIVIPLFLVYTLFFIPLAKLLLWIEGKKIAIITDLEQIV